VPDEIHQVGRVFTVVNGRGRIEADVLGVFAKQAGTNAVKRAGPAQRLVHDACFVAEDLARDPLDPLRHFGCRAARERHQQDPARIGAPDNQMGDAVSKRVGLAGPGTGDDQEGSSDMAVGGDAVLDGSTARRCSGLSVSRYDAAVVASTNCRPSRTSRSVILLGTATR
jgi:hypothetical protein